MVSCLSQTLLFGFGLFGQTLGHPSSLLGRTIPDFVRSTQYCTKNWNIKLSQLRPRLRGFILLYLLISCRSAVLSVSWKWWPYRLLVPTYTFWWSHLVNVPLTWIISSGRDSRSATWAVSSERKEPLDRHPIAADQQPILIEKGLTRSIGHIVKFSLRPWACDAVHNNALHYALTGVISFSFPPRRPVLYPTHMSRTGWGIRELGDPELSFYFEQPDYLTWSDRFLRDIIPLQMCRAVIDAVTKLPRMEHPNKSEKLELSMTTERCCRQRTLFGYRPHQPQSDLHLQSEDNQEPSHLAILSDFPHCMSGFIVF